MALNLRERIAQMGPEELRDLYSKLFDPPQVTLANIYIRDKATSRLINLKDNLNDTQRALYADLGYDGGPVIPRNIKADVVKFRQPGVSTAIIGMYFVDAANTPNSSTRILAHNPTSTTELLGIAQIMGEELDPNLRATKITKEGVEFTEIRSTIQVLFVGSRGAGRGTTLRNLHLSERAWWPPNGDEIEHGLLDTLPPEVGNVLRETTGHGFNEFFEQYSKAQRGEAGLFKAFFYGWNKHKEYVLPVPPHFRPDEEERHLQEVYGLTNGQLQFRRVKKAEAERLGKSFEQEYPLTATEAFQGSSTNAYYNQKYLKWLMDELQKPEYDPVTLPVELEHIEGLEIYEYPEEGVEYVFGVDCAKGVEKVTNERDYSTMDGARTDTWFQTVGYYGQPPCESFADILHLVGKFFNNAELIIENDPRGYGARVIKRLKELDYPNIYHHKFIQRNMGDKTPEPEAGYPARTLEKQQRNAGLQQAMEDAALGFDTVFFKNKRLVAELLRIVDLGGGDVRGEGTSKDDHNTSGGLLYYGLTRKGRPLPPVEQEWIEDNPEEPVILYGGGRRLRV